MEFYIHNSQSTHYSSKLIKKNNFSLLPVKRWWASRIGPGWHRVWGNDSLGQLLNQGFQIGTIWQVHFALKHFQNIKVNTCNKKKAERNTRCRAQASYQSIMTAGVGVWRSIELDTRGHPQVFFCGKCETKKGCERESGPAGETRTRSWGDEERRAERKEGRADGWTDWGSLWLPL